MRFRSVLDEIKTYEAGKPIELVVRDYGINPSDVVKLASNENPFGCSAKVLSKIATLTPHIHRYPDDSYYALKTALANRYSVENSNIIIGSGSDQIFEFISHAILEQGDTVLQNKITFAMYDIYTRQAGAKTIRTDSDLHDLAQFEANLIHNPKIIYLTTPSNPLGDALDRDVVFQFLKRVSPETLVVIDAAYMEYAAAKDPKKLIDPKDLIAEFPNAIYTGTFSKAYGLGGLRVGYGIGEPKIIEALHKMRAPFNITSLSMAAAIEALGDQEFVQKSIAHNFREMKRYEIFADASELVFVGSYTNFIALFFPHNQSATKTAKALLERGVIVRDLASYGLNALRVTVGLASENDRFFELMQEVRK
ncbi:histidinol-phosphate aminotransferase [Campylobacterota bacterium]|nr:histidinol-phosphate aminotransferase [Campylobacterota bacterium]